MATHIASANGNFTATTTWNDADTTSFLNSETGNTAVTTSFVASSAFTPGAITIDGIGIKIASRAASPTGTITVQLFHGATPDAATSVTVNVSDLPTCSATSGTTAPVSTAEGGWFFFKFASPFTFTAATAYTLQVKTSSASQVNLWRDSTAANWSRFLRLSANTGSVAAGDDFVITKEWTAAGTGTARTVTMDSTAATDYGNNAKTQVTPALAICQGGTLAFGTASSTAYVLQLSGYAIVYNGGTFRMGTTTGDIPTGSTATLQFDSDVAAGDFGLVIRNGGTATTGGSPRTSGKVFDRCLLNADASGTATTLTVDTDTGWLNGDIVAIASTTQTASQWEQRTLSGDAGASSFSITAGLTNAHSGTSPTQAEIVLITRNVVIKPTNTARQTFVYCGAAASVTFNWTQIDHGGAGTDSKSSIAGFTTTGALTLNYCSANDTGWFSIFMTGSADNISASYFVSVNGSRGHIFQTASAMVATTFDHVICVGGTLSNGAFKINSASINVTNLTVTSTTSNGLEFASSATATGTFSNIVGHSNSGAAFAINTGATITGLTVSGITAWRNSGANGGMFIDGVTNCVFNNYTAFGNNGRCMAGGTGTMRNVIFSNPTFNGDTTFATTDGFRIPGLCYGLYIYSGNLSTASGIKTALTNDIDIPNATDAQIYLDNTILAGSNALVGQTNLSVISFIRSQRQDQTDGKHRSYYPQGTILPNSGTVHTAGGLSEQMAPSSATTKLYSQSLFVACASGKTCTPTVYVQKDGSYNGNAPRLIVRRQDSMGVTSDTVLATFSASSGVWQALSGTTVAATEDGVFEFVVDCDGTAGNIFVDDASATTA